MQRLLCWEMNEHFTIAVLKWYEVNRRELPWRGTRDPYAVWLSEIILQQTRIEQGRAYWERFMERWPTVKDLAAATEDEVLRMWQGLGYYSRARNLHTAARQIVAMGGFPQTLEGIKSLKGVGDYTAAAIGSISFGLPAAVVDGNVYRVLARYFGIDTPINTTEGKKLFTALAQELLPNDRAADFNQAMMDFGAIQCTPLSPRCLLCPLMESCDALRTGRIAELPVKRKTLTVKTRHLTYIYIRCEGHTAIHRRPAGDIWHGLWEPYCIEHSTLSIEHSALSIEHLANNNVQCSIFNVQCLKRGVRHVLTHQIILADFCLWECDERPDLPEDYIWIPEEDIDRYGVPRLVEKLLEVVRSSSFILS